MAKEVFQFFTIAIIAGLLFYMLATMTGCFEENGPAVNSFWKTKIKENIAECKTMCSISSGWYHVYNYPTDSCYCRKNDGITWKTYRIYEEDGVYIETDSIGQIDIKLNK